jgi:hypothetical protein
MLSNSITPLKYLITERIWTHWLHNKQLQTHQTIFFCILSVFDSSVITFNLKAGGGI